MHLFLVTNCLWFTTIFSANPLQEYFSDPNLHFIFNTNDETVVPEFEIVYLPNIQTKEGFGEADEVMDIDYRFEAFKRSIDLSLKPNNNLKSQNFKTFIWHNDSTPHAQHYSRRNCHFLHKDGFKSAALSMCKRNAVQGLIFLDNSTLEVHPIPRHLQRLLKRTDNSNEGYPHIIRRALFVPKTNPNEVSSDGLNDNLIPLDSMLFKNKFLQKKAASHRPVGGLTLELALFFDEAGYKTFAPYLDYDEQKLQDMLLAYINAVQALYHHPSLGESLELALVRLDIMKTQPSNMPHYEGERMKLLDSFCAYQKNLNPKGDETPDHWDMALYVSGLDFFAYENGNKNGGTMGLATVGGVCLEKYNCIIAELGTTNIYGKPYPSAGFTSVYILAHEMGHNLGMHHDSSGNTCPKEGYIMSPSRGTNGETQWSTCSAKVMSELSWAKCLNDSPGTSKPSLDHSRFLDTPGQSYAAKKQCEILLRDRDAVVSSTTDMSKICQNLRCKTHRRSGFYNAGPALEGTTCGKGKYCFGGDCVARVVPPPTKIIPGGWSSWHSGPCVSGCIENSVGFQGRQRFCNNPIPLNTDEGCEGLSYSVALCNDDKQCALSDRMTAEEFASEKCADFAKILPQLDSKGVGLQAPHEQDRLWMSCAIFCKRSDSDTFFTPRVELNDLGKSPYYPDGTLCHKDNEINYYCVQHHCLPEYFQFTKIHFLKESDDDIPLSQNAQPHTATLSPEIVSYLSLGPNGLPLKDKLKPGEVTNPKEEEWEINDYLELPDLVL